MTKLYEYEQGAELTSIDDVKNFTGHGATIDSVTANILKTMLQYAPQLPDFSGKDFAFADGTCYTVDSKSKVKKLEELPDWYLSTADLKRGAVLSQFGLSLDSSLSEAISALTGKADAVASIFDVRFNHPASTVERLKSTQTTQGTGRTTKPRVERVSAYTVTHVIDRLKIALQSGDGEDLSIKALSDGNGMTRPLSLREVRTIFKAITGENVPNANAIKKGVSGGMWDTIRRNLESLPDDFTEQLQAKVESFIASRGDNAFIEDFRF